MADFPVAWLSLTWRMILESALMLLFGFVLAGIIRALLTPTSMKSLFGRGRLTQIVTASVIGVPLPLCSCSVLPVTAQLRKSGLSREGTVSFLISTPETGADSIALSYKLLGPFFAIVRPVAALVTAFAAGLVSYISSPAEKAIPVLQTFDNPGQSPKGLGARLWAGQKYVAGDILPDLAYYLFWGYLAAGAAAALIPGDILQSGLAPWLQYLGVIAVSLPVYVCATSSTPLAAVLLSLGIMPGAVLAFLLVGPATNLTSLVVQKRILGLRTTVTMTLVVIVCAIGLGIAVDYLAGDAAGSVFRLNHAAEGEEPAKWYDVVSAVALGALMLYYTGRHYFRKLRKKLNR